MCQNWRIDSKSTVFRERGSSFDNSRVSSGLDNSLLRGSGLSCASYDALQNPWPLYWVPAAPSSSSCDKSVSRFCQMSPVESQWAREGICNKSRRIGGMYLCGKGISGGSNDTIKGTRRENKRLMRKSIKSTLPSPSCGCQQQSEHYILSGKSFFKNSIVHCYWKPKSAQTLLVGNIYKNEKCFYPLAQQSRGGENFA